MDYVDLSNARDILLGDGLVGIPTETVYGLGGLATSQRAVDLIYEYKHRPKDNPLICHFYDINHILEYVRDIPQPIITLIEKFCPGPITFLLSPKDDRLAPATIGQPLVGCRIPDNPDTLALIRLVNAPLAAPSANPSGKPSSTTPEMVFDYFRDYFGGILYSKPSKIGLESTIISYEDNSVMILREGAIGADEIATVLPNIDIIKPENTKHVVPGSKYRHYSPEATVKEVNSLDQIDKGESNVVVLLTKDYHLQHPEISPVIYLSDKPDIYHVSRNLYKVLWEVDKRGYQVAYWLTPDLDYTNSIGQALKNRLSRILK